jgi:hypothetical protein
MQDWALPLLNLLRILFSIKKRFLKQCLQGFVEQEDLRVEIVAVCDIFDTYATEAVAAPPISIEKVRMGNWVLLPKNTALSRIACRSGCGCCSDSNARPLARNYGNGCSQCRKTVYVEKPMTWTVPENYLLRETIKRTGIVFQLDIKIVRLKHMNERDKSSRKICW